jgi:hypothetical protein
MKSFSRFSVVPMIGLLMNEKSNLKLRKAIVM